MISGPLTVNQPAWTNSTPNVPATNWTYTPEGSTAASLTPGSDSFSTAIASLELTSAEQQEISSATNMTPTNASWMTRTVHLEADTTYTMSWNFISGDYVPYDDGSFTTLVFQGAEPEPTVLINNEAKNYALLGFTTSPGNYSTGTYGSTRWQRRRISTLTNWRLSARIRGIQRRRHG